jgi:cytochrome P450
VLDYEETCGAAGEVSGNSVAPDPTASENNNQKWNGPLKKSLTNDEILAQAILFFAAGYETTTTVLCFVIHQLAINPQHQTRLCDELDRAMEKNGGQINYELTMDTPYMDMVINETLRLYPPAFRTDRVCNEDYFFNGIRIEKGQVWTASIYAVHHDPSIYPEPYTFDPERFSEAGKRGRDNEAFMPFGAGPRNCIAMRFALIEMKLLLATVLSRFQFEKCDQTSVTFLLYFLCLHVF